MQEHSSFVWRKVCSNLDAPHLNFARPLLKGSKIVTSRPEFHKGGLGGVPPRYLTPGDGPCCMVQFFVLSFLELTASCISSLQLLARFGSDPEEPAFKEDILGEERGGGCNGFEGLCDVACKSSLYWARSLSWRRAAFFCLRLIDGVDCNVSGLTVGSYVAASDSARSPPGVSHGSSGFFHVCFQSYHSGFML